MKRMRTVYKTATFGFSKQLLYSYICILIVALLLFSSVIYYSMVSMLKSRMLASSTETMEQVAINMQQYMHDVETLMFTISVNPLVQNYLSSKTSKSDFKVVNEVQDIVNQMLSVDVFARKTGGVYLFADYQDKYPIFRVNYLRPEAGYIGKSAVFRAEEIRTEKWYQDSIHARGKAVWSTPATDTIHSEAMFSVSRIIINTKITKEPLGVVRVFVPNGRFQNIIENISFGANGSTYLYAGGSVLDCDDTEKTKSILKVVQNNGVSTTRQYIGSDKCYVIVCDAGISDWKLVGIIPEKTILSQFKLAKGILLPSLLFVFLLTFLLMRILSKSLSEPIHQVAEAMQNYNVNRSKRFQENKSGEIGMLFTSFNRMMNHIDFLLREVQETSDKQRRAELQALQAQINPHFLYNTLDCIKSIACLNDSKEIIDLTTALSEFFRISLNKGSEELMLKKELLHVQNYCAIQKYRNHTSFELRIQVSENMMQRNVIKLILQPLVENSIIHGFAGMDQTGVICISARDENGFFVLSVSDNGLGTDTEFLNGVLSGEYKTTDKGDMHSGYGIKNVDERIKLSYGKDSGLKYTENEDGNGITAEIWIKQKEHEDERENVWNTKTK